MPDSDKKNKENIITYLQNFKKKLYRILNKIQNYTLVISNIFEKSANLMCWIDNARTTCLLVLIIIFLMIVIIIPFKLILYIALCSEFYTGISYYKRRYIHNRKIVNALIEYTIKSGVPEFE